MTTAPDPRAEGERQPSADPLPAGVAQVFVDYANAEYAQANGPVPYTLTPQAETALDVTDPEAEPDAYWQEAHAAYHRLAAEDARIWADPEAESEPEAGDPGCFPELEAEPW